MKRNRDFWDYVDKTGECWIWIGGIGSHGYGVFRSDHLAHRRAYELVKGPIPDGLTIDHLCRNRPCVNPAHLEAVTMKENILRSDSPTAINARKTHCDSGHAYDEANTYIRPDGKRDCRRCKADRELARRLRRPKRVCSVCGEQNVAPEKRPHKRPPLCRECFLAGLRRPVLAPR